MGHHPKGRIRKPTKVHNLKIHNLIETLRSAELDASLFVLEDLFEIKVNKKYLDGKGEELINQVFSSLGGKGHPILLETLKFDFRINRFLFLYDDEVNFNRYRLSTLKTDIYEVFSYQWVDSHKRLCRTYERECLKTGLLERIWFGPPLASKVFGKGETPGELTGSGSPGWKLNAYNDAQYDLISRLHGFKLIRISGYENIMTGGSLKKINDLLLNPKEENQKAIANWLLRKLE